MALKALGAFVLLAAFLIVAARALFPVPTAGARIRSGALPPPGDGPLAAAFARHAGATQTGIATLRNGADAFAVRMVLADAATRSIDARYYIWQGDLTGTLLIDALRRAADRDVRVRLLLDDNGIPGLDAMVAALDRHPMIEVRLWNPFQLRHAKGLCYLFDFLRLNRRMHNKSFTVDGLATVIGGRNVGDEYFAIGPMALYIDLDVLAVGAVLPSVTADFDLYWAAPAAFPAGPVLGPMPEGADAVATRLAALRTEPEFDAYRRVLDTSPVAQALVGGAPDLEWTDAVLVSDDPGKGGGPVPRKALLTSRLADALGRVHTRFDGISPYFVPGKAGVDAFAAMIHHGIAVRILTNSLDATSVLPVHAGYARWRKRMLQSGVELHEMRPIAAPDTPKRLLGSIGSSGASLHAKTFAVDGRRVFVGSFNFDPRSATLNTEMGLLIDSPRMAGVLAGSFEGDLLGQAWRVRLEGRKLVWIDPSDGTKLTHEPGATLPRRVALAVIGLLPVEWLL